MNKYILIVGIVVVAGIGLYMWSTSTGTQAPASTEVSEQEAMKKVVVNLQEQNESGESGTATITEMEGGVKVAVSLVGVPEGVTQPVHIHVNSCVNIAGVQYPLESLINGSSETMLEVSMAELQAGLPLSVNVHKSVEEISVYVVCGDIAL